MLTMIKLIQKTWGELYNGPQTYEQLLRLRELEKMEIQVREEREKIMEIACEVADAIMRIQYPNMQFEITDEEGNTSYTEEAQEKFNEIYDVFCSTYDQESSLAINEEMDKFIAQMIDLQAELKAMIDEEEGTIG